MTWNKTLRVGAKACRFGIVLAMSVSWCALSSSSFAVTTNWTGSINDLWTEAGNWTMGVPGSGDTANILGTFGSPFNVDLNGTQDVANITLNADWTTFSNGRLDQNRNTVGAFTANNVTFTADGEFADAGNINWTNVTRPNGDRDSAWNPGNGTQIILNSVSSDTSGTYLAAHWNPNPTNSAFDVTADNTQYSHWVFAGNPVGPNTGSLTLQNGSLWLSETSWSTGMNSGIFTLTIDDSELEIVKNNNNATFGPNTKLVTDNGKISIPADSTKVFHNQIDNPARFDGEGLTFEIIGNSNATVTFEAASEDLGPWLDGYVENSGNFSFDRLEMQNTFNSIFLADTYDNSTGNALTEAIYAKDLVVLGQIGDTPATEGLDLRGINIYYQNLTGDLSQWNVFDSVGGGSIQQVTSFLPVAAIPEPSTAWLAGLGIALLAGRRKRKRNAA